MTLRFQEKDGFFNLQLWTILLLGFSSGLPFLLTLSSLSFWLTESGINKTTIGMFMFISLPYSLKFLWAPLTDRIQIPFLSNKFGRRRSWALVAQLGLILSIIALGFCNPSRSIAATAFCAFLVTMFSATQDIVYDAYRIEIISDRNRGMAAALESVGFRFGMLASGAGALYLASFFDWQTAYHLMAGTMLVGVFTVLMMPEPQQEKIVALHTPQVKHPILQRIKMLTLDPWHQFHQQKILLSLILFIFCFKLADAVLNAMSAPFLYDLGFSKTDFANVTKIFGITLMVIGGLLGGLVIKRFGTLNAVILSTLMQGMSCLMFAIQALVGYDYQVLMITVGAESLCSGLTSTVFIAYISEFCCKPHTATHFTLLYSIGSFARVIASASAGWLADHCSWELLFLFSSLFVIPTIVFVLKVEAQRTTEKLENKFIRAA